MQVVSASASAGRRTSVFFFTSLVVIAGASAALALLGRSRQDLSVDEPFTAAVVEQGLASLPAALPHDNAPLMYLALAGWSAVAGMSPFALRVLPALAFAAAVVLTGVSARRLAGGGAGLLAALAIACSTRIGLLHAATVRPYAFLALAAAAALLCLVSIPSARSRRAAAGWAAGAGVVYTAGLFLHPTFVFVVGASVVAGLAVRLPVRYSVAPGFVALALYAVSWGAVFLETLRLPATAWMPRAGFADLVAAVEHIWSAQNAHVLGGILVATLLLRGRSSCDLVRSRELALPAIAAAAALLAPFAVSQVKPVFAPLRTPILALPAIAATIGVVLARLGTRPLRVAVGLLLVAGAVRYSVAEWRRGDPAPTGASVAAVLAEARCGDRIVAAGLAYMPVSYAARRHGMAACLQIEAFPPDMRWHPGWFDPGEVDETAAHELVLIPAAAGSRVFVFGASRGVSAEASAALEAMFDREMRRDETRPLRGSFFDHVAVYRPRVPR